MFLVLQMQQLPQDFFDSKVDLAKYEKLNKGKTKAEHNIQDEEIVKDVVQEEFQEDLKVKEEEKRKDQEYEQEQYRKRYIRLKSLQNTKRRKNNITVESVQSTRNQTVQVEPDTYSESD